MKNKRHVLKSYLSPSILYQKPKLNWNGSKYNLKEKAHVSLNKTNFKKMVAWLQDHYGEHTTFLFLETLKSVGFKYATKSGLSLGIDDLKSFSEKKFLLSNINKNLASLDQNFEKQNVSPLEKSQYFITKWAQISKTLVQKIYNTFPKKEPLNPLALMAFSGARGNISQVSQLIGLRGLMADPLGNLVEFPIQGNFREGMTLTEYFISCYGARKGLVDTALRTATAGYLTRRLIYVAQHVYISIKDCDTSNGLFFHLKDKTIKELQGLTLLFNFYGESFIPKDTIISPQIIKKLNLEVPKKLNQLLICRSIFTCKLSQTICQSCYGWDNARGVRVDIGEAVGILAAQSIGEPGTQLTLRTFHTGGVGVFSASNWTSYRAPFSGVVRFKKPLLGKILRAWIVMPNHTLSHMAFRLKERFEEQSPLVIKSLNSNNIYKKDLAKSGLLFVREGEIIEKNQLLFSEINLQSNHQNDARTFIPYHSPENGKLLFAQKKRENFSFMHHLWLFGYNLAKLNLSSMEKLSYIHQLATFSFKSTPLKKKDLIEATTPLFQMQILNQKDCTEIEEPLYDFWNSLTLNQYHALKFSLLEIINSTLNINEQRLSLDYIKLTTTPEKLLKHKINTFFVWDSSKFYINLNKGAFYYFFKFKTFNLKGFIYFNQIFWFFSNNLLTFPSNFSFYKKKKHFSFQKKRNTSRSLGIKKNKKLIYSKKIEIVKKSIVFHFEYLDLKKISLYSKTLYNYFRVFEKILLPRYSIKLIKAHTLGEFKGFFLNQNTLYWASTPLKSIKIISYKVKKKTLFGFTRWNSNLEQTPFSGYIINKKLNDFTLQLGLPFILPSHTIYHKGNGDLILKNELLCSFKTIKQETQDIVQGIPKIEALLEGRPLLDYDPILDLANIWINTLSILEDFTLKNPFSISGKDYSEVYLKFFETKYTYLSLGELCEAAYLHTIVNFGTNLGTLVSKVYADEGVDLSFKHIKLIIRELVNTITIINPGHSGFFPGEEVYACIVFKYNNKLRNLKLKEISFRPLILGMTECTRKKNSFGVAGSFQNLREILIKHSLEHRKDYLLGLHENLLFNQFIPAGTGFFK